MTRNETNFILIVGFIITFGGVGGIEVSQTDTEMMGSMIVSIIGLLVMYAGILAMRVLDSRG
tara:strand:+ start:1765 stop:1950 length:186 start_codon:yes stop_codon:yes gene_type:complete